MPRVRQRRPDLQAGTGQGQAPVPAQAPTAATGLPYGEHKALLDAQTAVPLPGGTPSLPAGPAAAALPPSGGGGWDQILSAAGGHPPPNLAPLSGPSQRPDQPTTAGLSSGPGPGPEILPGAPKPMGQLSRNYLAMFQQTGDPAWKRLADAAAARGQ